MDDTALHEPRARVEWRKGRRIAFYIAVLLGLASMAVTGPALTLPVTAWLPEATLDAMFGQNGLGIHRIHVHGTGLLFWLIIVAFIAQIGRPERRPAPLWAAAAAMVVLLPLDWTNEFDPFSIIIALPVLAVLALHPHRWPTTPIAWRREPRLLAISFTIMAAIYAYQQAILQVNGIPQDTHVAGSHYALMAAMAVGLGVSALLGATNFPGHLISAWAAGLMALAIGAFSIGHPGPASSVGAGWGTAIVIWGVVYLLVTSRATHAGARRDPQAGIAS